MEIILKIILNFAKAGEKHEKGCLYVYVEHIF